MMAIPQCERHGILPSGAKLGDLFRHLRADSHRFFIHRIIDFIAFSYFAQMDARGEIGKKSE
jgi:hypothetical protein